MGSLVIVFFVSIVLSYYKMVYDERRDNIIKSGKMAAYHSADQFGKYLSTNVDLINFTAYTLDEMISEHKSDEEIQNYLVAQSTAVKNAVLENHTGLYGYINNRFFSGTNWIPPEGYDATTRPWYTKPFTNPGQLTILEPYTDVQTGNTMLALGKTLCDGVSVISVDVSLDQMQMLTEQAVLEGEADIEMILTGEGIVVTHSDISEVGKNYSAEDDTFGNNIVRLLSTDHDGFFEFKYDGTNYIAYSAVFQDDWHCVSVYNTTYVFSSLTQVLIFTIVVVILIMLIMGVILVNSNRRGMMAQHAIAANNAKSAFLSNMSHEIRTPINAILGMNEMILRESSDGGIKTYAENVKNAGNTLLGLVNDILDFSKIEAGKMEIRPEEYDLSVVLYDLVNQIKNKAEEKGLKLNISFDHNIPKDLFGDDIRLRQVMVNLLTNAVKYTEEGCVDFNVSYDNSDDDDSILLKVSVKDTGIGIKKEDLDRLFTEFERLEENRNRNIEGTGLGMNITAKLLEMMGSHLVVESEYGKGSVFSFDVKQKVTAFNPLGDYEESYKKAVNKAICHRHSFKADNAKILVVDDYPMNLMVISSLLKPTNIMIDTAESGDEGLKLAFDQKYDVIFFDHMMPVKDGIETLHDLRDKADNPNIATPVICLTANAIAGAKEQYLSEGFDDYLTKPIDLGHLENILLRYIPADKVEMLDEDDVSDYEDQGNIPDELMPLLDNPVINIQDGIVNSGSADAYMSVLKVFYTSMGERSDELNRLFSDKDLKDYTIKIHALKSSARIIGAPMLGEKAQALENAGKSGDMEYIDENHEEFMKDYLSLKEPLSIVFLSQDESDDKEMISIDSIKGSIAVMRAAADDMDCDRLFEIFESVDKFSIPDEYKALFKKLKDATENFDYDAIIDLIDKQDF